MRVILWTVIYGIKVTEPQISHITEFIGQYRRNWEDITILYIFLYHYGVGPPFIFSTAAVLGMDRF
jgi:hypothetical protein